MKKLKTIVAVVAMLLTVTSFATGIKEAAINEKVKASFKKGFSAATNISWEKKNDVYFADFTLNDHSVEAAFNENGDLIALSNSIDANQMPLAINVAISNDYSGYEVVTKVKEITYEFQTYYYMTISNNKQLFKLKCAANGAITVEHKQKIN
jgi:hypothetical protein